MATTRVFPVRRCSTDEDARIEATVRPANFDDYIGLECEKENLQITVEAARNSVWRRGIQGAMPSARKT
jgi:Holliday junction resolvasome RuvABC ATP-dependent DNA helicase subunit